MADRYQTLTESPPGRFIAQRLGLPQPAQLRRQSPGDPVLRGPALIGGASSGRLLPAVAEVLAALEGEALVPARGPAQAAAEKAGLRTRVWNPEAEEDDETTRFAALLYDASGVERSEDLHEVYEFFHAVVRRLEPSGRLLILATPPEACKGPRHAVAQRALEGFVRSVGKEVGRGATAQLLYVAPKAEGNLESTLRFFLSGRSAYVSGQVVRIGAGKITTPADWDRPLADRVALVTGASRGIGRAIAETLARDGAHVVCLDVPDQGEALVTVANRVGGSALQLDITSQDAPHALLEHLRTRHGGVDVVAHNAGVTRDKTLGRMSDAQWDQVIAINLTSQERINDALLESDVLRPHGRIVSVSSVSGIAGNRGQVNYGTSKAGVIGTVDALAPVMAKRPATINAVAPGFIETAMTAAMPIATREAGRRINSLSQGGLPIDVAETIAWLASPGSGGVNGNVVRVDGQSILGA